jgi:hypothetical protein
MKVTAKDILKVLDRALTGCADQRDVNNEYGRLIKVSKSLRADVARQTGKAVAAPALTGESGDTLKNILDDVVTLTNHVNELQAMLDSPSSHSSKQAGASVTAIKPATLTERVLAAKGASHAPAVANPSGTSAKKQTLTERVLAAKGVKTLGELKPVNPLD